MERVIRVAVGLAYKAAVLCGAFLAALFATYVVMDFVRWAIEVFTFYI